MATFQIMIVLIMMASLIQTVLLFITTRNRICRYTRHTEEWYEDYYRGECGFEYAPQGQGPIKEGFTFCPRCGRKIKEV